MKSGCQLSTFFLQILAMRLQYTATAALPTHIFAVMFVEIRSKPDSYRKLMCTPLHLKTKLNINRSMNKRNALRYNYNIATCIAGNK